MQRIFKWYQKAPSFDRKLHPMDHHSDTAWSGVWWQWWWTGELLLQSQSTKEMICPCIVKPCKSSYAQLTSGPCATARGELRQKRWGHISSGNVTLGYFQALFEQQPPETGRTRELWTTVYLKDTSAEGADLHSGAVRGWRMGAGTSHWAVFAAAFCKLILKSLFTPNTLCNVEFLCANHCDSFKGHCLLLLVKSVRIRP